MKKIYLSSLLFLISGILLVPSLKASSYNGTSLLADGDDSIIMGSGYINDVYYSLKKGITATPPRENWDISFRTYAMSSCILTNGAAGVNLYAYPKSDTSGWSTLDTAGLYSWKPLYNSIKLWENGAFMANAGTFPDYGWGVYNITSHKVIGDSLFVIKLRNGSFKKIWIVEKDAQNKYHVRYANLDGTKDTTIITDCKLYKTKEFVGYSISDNLAVDREPIKTDWNLLFTKYVEKISMGPGVFVDYPVMGVLKSDNVFISKVRGVNQQTYDDYTAHPFDSFNISIIGRDWKKSVGQPPVYSIVDTLVYFISDTSSGDIYKLYFKGFEDGSNGNGKVTFHTKLLNPTSIQENKVTANMVVYPNPATISNINLVYRFDNVKEFTLDVIDINGRIVSTQKINNKPGLNTISLSDRNLGKGIYVARVSTGRNIISSRFVITE